MFKSNCNGSNRMITLQTELPLVFKSRFKWLPQLGFAHLWRVQYGIVRFGIPLNTLQVILVTILRVRWPNQQCH